MTKPADRKIYCLNRLLIGCCTGLIFMFGAVTGVLAKAVHPLDDIRQVARKHVLASLPVRNDIEYSVTTDRLDSRLRLSQCEHPLTAWFPGQGRRTGNVTVGVRCTGAKPWSLYVPVKVHFYDDVFVTRRPLQRGTVIQLEDIELQRKNLSFYSADYFTSADEIIGKQLVHSMQIGMIVGKRNLKTPVIIKRGQQVTLMAQADTYEVRMAGEAMMDGSVGQRIKVKNTRSQRIIEGVVKSSKIIYIE